MSNPGSEAWSLLFRLFMSQRGRLPQVAVEFDLSPMQAHVLRLLEPGRPVPMRSLARSLRCDASNVTGIIDRLEDRGLVLRAALKTDRRVKMLVVSTDCSGEKRAMAQTFRMSMNIGMRIRRPRIFGMTRARPENRYQDMMEMLTV